MPLFSFNQPELLLSAESVFNCSFWSYLSYFSKILELVCRLLWGHGQQFFVHVVKPKIELAV